MKEIKCRTRGYNIIVDDGDAEKLKNLSILYNKSTLTYRVTGEEYPNGKSLASFLYNTNFKNQLKYKGSKNDFRKKNVDVVPISVNRRYRHNPERQYKGVIVTKDGYKSARWFVEKTYFSLFDNHASVEELAYIYNFGCDYFGFDGYRNDVNECKINPYHYIKLDEIKEKIIKRGLDSGY